MILTEVSVEIYFEALCAETTLQGGVILTSWSTQFGSADRPIWDRIDLREGSRTKDIKRSF